MTTAAPPKIEKTQGQKKAPRPASSLGSKLAKGTILAITIIAWQIVALLVVEFTLYLAGLGEEEIFKLDPVFGFVHMNNKRVTWRSEGYARSYLGPDGMREPGATIEKPAGVFRVALLGDSLVESLQVPIEETFGQILEKSIKTSASGRELQVLNFGNSGYSTAQEDLQLKFKVLKYKPDAVIVFYNHRDLFENWSPPDQTITNVRPYALHLPNQPLSIDNSSVKAWMKSPRGKFLNSITWLRENSRIWGLIAAWETQASFHDPVYRAVVGFLTNPVKSVQASAQEISKITPKTIAAEIVKSLKLDKSASFKIQFIDEQPGNKVAAKKETVDPAINSSIVNVPPLSEFPAAKVLSDEEMRAAAAKAEEEKKIAEAKAKEEQQKMVFFNLMYKTVNSLFQDMNSQCKEHNAKFAVVAVPSKLALSETSETIGPMELTYDKEIAAIKPLCRSNNIPFVDMQQELAKMPKKESDKLFYCMHLTPDGHQFVAKQALPLFKTLLDDKEQSK
ncbi:MAG: SGNH/GDSL hydrolase family protein [Candidatus Obscuribacterales bacterium]|nr:SGNH/GDSL hydrolase family protein [Candidatus Obscuribacterales bacterium]